MRMLISGFSLAKELGTRQSRSQSFVPLDQRSENESSGSNHYERTKEITEFWLSGSLRICIYGACLKWLLPELSFSDRWSRGTKLWERDWTLEQIREFPDTFGYVWTAENDSNTLRVDAKIFVSAKKCLRKKKFPNTCGHGLSLYSQSLKIDPSPKWRSKI